MVRKFEGDKRWGGDECGHNRGFRDLLLQSGVNDCENGIDFMYDAKIM